MNYAVCQIKGRQFIVKPNQIIEVDKLNLEDNKSLVVNEVLLMVDGDKVEVGSPFLKTPLTFDVLETIKKDKIRVAKFHAKANYRKVKGSRAQKTRIRLAGSEVVKKEVKSKKKETK